MKLLNVPDPLEQAVKLTRNLEELCPNNPQVWIVAYDLAVRRREFAVQLRFCMMASDAGSNQENTSRPYEPLKHCMTSALTIQSYNIGWLPSNLLVCYVLSLHHGYLPPHSVSSLPNLPPHIQNVLTEGLDKLIPSETSLEQFNTNYLQHNPNSGAALLGYARALYGLRQQDAVAEIEESLLQFKQTEMLFNVRVGA